MFQTTTKGNVPVRLGFQLQSYPISFPIPIPAGLDPVNQMSP
jgi:hypothetical protein